MIVKSGKNNGKDYIIRYPQMTDLRQLTDYINVLSKERTFIKFQGEHISHAQEKRFLTQTIKSILQNKKVFLLLIIDGNITGSSGIDIGSQVQSHVGVFGIVITKKYRSQGFGKILMTTVINEAKRNLKDLKIITLNVYQGNYAKDFYKQMGFVEYGKLPKGIKYKDNYIDMTEMYLKAKK